MFLTLILSFNFNQIFNNNLIKKNEDTLNNLPITETDLKLSDTPLDEYSGTGQAFNVTEYGNGYFQNYNLNITNNEKASIIVPEDWKANEITGTISKIYDYDSYFLNDTFDTGYDSNLWTNNTNNLPYVSFGWYDAPSGTNDSIYMKLTESGASWQNKFAYWNYTLFVPREQIAYEYWEVDFKYRALYSNTDWLPGASSTHILEVYVDGVSQEFGITKLDAVNIKNNTWQTGNIIFQPEIYNWQLPGTISLIFKIDYKNSFVNPLGYFEMYYDNITLKLSTIPKPSHINLTINDLTNDEPTIISDAIEYGEGTVYLQNLWEGDTGGKTHYFSFSHNSSGNVIIYSDFYTQALSSKKTNTQLGLEGSEFSIENNSKAQWTMFFIVNKPGSYSSNYYFNISRPINWIITQVIDPYSNNKINDVNGVGFGNTTLTIPNEIVTDGLWRFVAEAPNYLQQANAYRKNGINWIENTTFYIQDKIKINATIKTDYVPDIDLTNATLEIYYPNESLFYTEKASVSADGSIEFSKIYFGADNASIGKYLVYVKWSDQDFNMSQVGVYKLEFMLIHKSSLIATDSYFEQIAGAPLLLKVNYTDIDLNSPINFATVTYNSTFGSSGVMAYSGSGIYFVEIDTDPLGLGDYYFSFNASKFGYTNQTEMNLVHLKIIAQPLALEVPPRVIPANANDYAICQINVTGAISGALITDGANITTDWEKPYFVEDHYNGTFTLRFSTDDLPTQGIIETFLVTIFANKTNYGDTYNYLSIQISPTPAIVNINQSIVSVVLNTNFSLKVNYTIEASGMLIENATLKVSWASDYTVFPVSDGFVISFSTYNLLLQTYPLTFQLSRPGYQTAFKTVYVSILPQPTYLEIYLNGEDRTSNKTITISWNEELNITILYMDEITENFISGATVMLDEEGVSRTLNESGSKYYTIFSPSEFSVGTHFLTISIEKENYNFVSGILKINVDKIKISAITLDSTDSIFTDSLEVIAGSSALIKINLTEQNTRRPIEDATLTFSWQQDIGSFDYEGGGIYQKRIDIPQITSGSYRLTIIITTESGYYESTEISFLLVILQQSVPNYIVWTILILLLVVSGILGTFITRNYVLLPRKRKKEALFLSKIQVFKDVQNIQGIMLVKKESGMPFYTKNVSEYGFEDNILISGFIQAITLFGEQALKLNFNEEKKRKPTTKYDENTIELNFKFFHLLICDFDPLRSILILKQKSSDNLKKQFYLLSAEIGTKYSKQITQFKGVAIDFKSELDFLIDKFLFLYYIEPFRLADDYMVKSRELQPLESRVLNVIISLSKYKKDFTINNVIDEIEEKNLDLIYGALDTLIKKRIIIPIKFKIDHADQAPKSFK